MNLETLPSGKAIISQPSLCKFLDMTRSGLDKLKAKDPTFPKPFKTGNARQAACYYVMAEVQAWLNAKLETRLSA